MTYKRRGGRGRGGRRRRGGGEDDDNHHWVYRPIVGNSILPLIPLQDKNNCKL
jgi:hypothetical protein